MKLKQFLFITIIAMSTLFYFASCASSKDGLVTINDITLSNTKSISESELTGFKSFVEGHTAKGSWTDNSYKLDKPFTTSAEELSYFGKIKNETLTIDCSKYGIIETVILESSPELSAAENYTTTLNHTKILIPFGGDWNKENNIIKIGRAHV